MKAGVFRIWKQKIFQKHLPYSFKNCYTFASLLHGIIHRRLFVLAAIFFCETLNCRSNVFFYNLDQIVCVGACVGEVRNKLGDLEEFIPLDQTSNSVSCFSNSK